MHSFKQRPQSDFLEDHSPFCCLSQQQLGKQMHLFIFSVYASIASIHPLEHGKGQRVGHFHCTSLNTTLHIPETPKSSNNQTFHATSYPSAGFTEIEI